MLVDPYYSLFLPRSSIVLKASVCSPGHTQNDKADACAATLCTEQECCDVNPSCAPSDCTPATHHRNINVLPCADTACAVDTAECCLANATCLSFACAAQGSFLMRDAAAVCAGDASACTLALCCDRTCSEQPFLCPLNYANAVTFATDACASDDVASCNQVRVVSSPLFVLFSFLGSASVLCCVHVC
jgi:hypothetical protein